MAAAALQPHQAFWSARNSLAFSHFKTSQLCRFACWFCRCQLHLGSAPSLVWRAYPKKPVLCNAESSASSTWSPAASPFPEQPWAPLCVPHDPAVCPPVSPCDMPSFLTSNLGGPVMLPATPKLRGRSQGTCISSMWQASSTGISITSKSGEELKRCWSDLKTRTSRNLSPAAPALRRIPSGAADRRCAVCPVWLCRVWGAVLSGVCVLCVCSLCCAGSAHSARCALTAVPMETQTLCFLCMIVPNLDFHAFGSLVP